MLVIHSRQHRSIISRKRGGDPTHQSSCGVMMARKRPAMSIDSLWRFGIFVVHGERELGLDCRETG